jgi:hypothetical protein
MVAVALSGCVTKKACERRYGPCGGAFTETTITKIPVSFWLPERAVTAKVALWQSAYSELRHDTLVYTDSSGRARLELAVDSLGNLYARCTALAAKVDTVITEKSTTQRVIDYVTESKTPWHNWLIMGLLTLLLLALAAKHWFG